MRADDPRHGSYAGAIRHWKDGEKPCPPCALKASRTRKQSRLTALRTGPRRVDLGQRAWEIVRDTPRNLLSARTGIRHPRLSEYEKGGPQKKVSRATRARILAAAGHWTPLGMQRRLQALSALGWSMRVVSQESGIDMDALKRLRRRETPKFVRTAVAEAILETYEKLQMALPPAGGAVTKTRNEARRCGWLPPLVWDNIDDPHEQPATGSSHRDDDIDDVVVQRLLAGDRIPSTRAEKDEAMRQWKAAGRPERQLCQMHGWKDARYGREEDAA